MDAHGEDKLANLAGNPIDDGAPLSMRSGCRHSRTHGI
jgi:hypothetical protein